ncbi:hypothetical protein EJB05_20989 [Eragrostis curvula]|uniref:Uncharacterized protein n=1 Tax=Eragrostis curvula TaxID=38414 RepID=A0A5J9V1N2_9POAL|nr:hypothetical protein EJB05_20989 [Eragrostis curvula]
MEEEHHDLGAVPAGRGTTPARRRRVSSSGRRRASARWQRRRRPTATFAASATSPWPPAELIASDPAWRSGYPETQQLSAFGARNSSNTRTSSIYTGQWSTSGIRQRARLQPETKRQFVREKS